MRNRQLVGRRGFTLVELMTVVAIIVLLISVLVPALNSARVQAKRAATSSLLKSLDGGCEMFQNEFGRYPQSRGLNPFQEPGDQVLMMGFQWLGLQLVGPDTRGIVDWNDVQNDMNNDQIIDYNDWRDWYSLTPTREVTRKGPYVPVDGDVIQSMATIISVKADFTQPPNELTDGDTTNWPNSKIPFFIDAFNNPVLYYRANSRVDAPYTTGEPANSFVVGRYDQSDNGAITGTSGTNGRYAVDIGPSSGWDLTGTGSSGPHYHRLGYFGYDVSTPLEYPDDRTFASFTMDGKIFDNTYDSNTQEGRVWPHKDDTFMLITAGEDGVYGTADDITNFASKD